MDDIAASLDTSAYITGMAARYRHQMVTQVPGEIRCFTKRRHNRSRVRNTSLGRLCVSPLLIRHWPSPAEMGRPTLSSETRFLQRWFSPQRECGFRTRAGLSNFRQLTTSSSESGVPNLRPVSRNQELTGTGAC
jgi:hypothetical protein